MKKRIIALLALELTILPASAGERDRKPVEFADPYIMLHNGTYYLYGTRYKDGIGVLVSDNLKTWHIPDDGRTRLALDMKDSYGDRWFWAPEVYHIGDKFIMYYSSDEHICAAESDSPAGPFVQKAKVPLRSEKGIDNHLFIDSDGKPYIYWVRFNKGNEIWVAELDEDCETVKAGTERLCTKPGQDWEMNRAKVNEGPLVLKHDGTYYLVYSGSDFRSQDYALGYATASSPYGPWTKYVGNPIFRRPEGLFGVGHNAMFVDKRGRLMTVFHSHKDSSTVGPRTTHITRAYFRKGDSGKPDILHFSPKYRNLEME